VYCGPLRLLAREIAQRLNKVNVPCSLITGQERDEIEGAKHSSVTVEMADVSTEYQCAVIDEIQVSKSNKHFLDLLGLVDSYS
jgi:ATP-dependent RNA helicase SUPV3L1/SUV3